MLSLFDGIDFTLLTSTILSIVVIWNHHFTWAWRDSENSSRLVAFLRPSDLHIVLLNFRFGLSSLSYPTNCHPPSSLLLMNFVYFKTFSHRMLWHLHLLASIHRLTAARGYVPTGIGAVKIRSSKLKEPQRKRKRARDRDREKKKETKSWRFLNW